jgi:hypothetical protein
VQVVSPVTDDLIRELVTGPPSRVFGVDIPFGWPMHFVQFVAAHMGRVTPPPGVTSTQKRLSSTDEHI